MLSSYLIVMKNLMKHECFSLLFEVLRTSYESTLEKMLIGVESVKREVDFMENEGKTIMLTARNRLSVSVFQPMPCVQRCAEEVEGGNQRCSASIRTIKVTNRHEKSMYRWKIFTSMMLRVS